MTDATVLATLQAGFARHFDREPSVTAYAPGRVEVLGNHTDYNEGSVLSAAINLGTYFAAAPREDAACRLVALDVNEEVTFDAPNPRRSETHPWSNYVIGVAAGLRPRGAVATGFDGMFFGNVPLGAGLSSSAALEISAGLALCELYGIALDRLSLAAIGQAAEHKFAGARTGLLDQISSLFGRRGALVMSDFRSLDVRTVPLGQDACFLMCNTHAAHVLVEGKYNQRRESCENAARFFAAALPHPVAALRDVSQEEWDQHAGEMDSRTARRAAHVIGENRRVREGCKLLEHGRLEAFGRLMFESHESSISNFDNSCRELDVVVSAARRIPGVLGARLSGGGFGGSAVVLVNPRDAETVAHALGAAYEQKTGAPCDVRTIEPSDGARLV